MNKDEFIIWLKGFLDALKGETFTVKKWEIITDKLKTVVDDKPDWLTNPNTWKVDYPNYSQPLDSMYGIFKVTCGEGTTSNSTYVNTTHVITFNQNVPHTLTDNK